jgi:tripartite-type tricarboxylate transporter receptor subunit TctC
MTVFSVVKEVSMKKFQVLGATLTLAGVATLGFNPVLADTFPSHAIRVIVPFAPGGSTDIIARLVTQRMAQELGQPMVVENKAGAGGAVGATEGARAKPDGYTLSVATVSTMAVLPACRPKDLPYNPIKDFAPVTNFANTANVISVNPKFPAKDFAGFVEELKKNPGKYSYGSSGTCSVLHLFGEAFRMATGTDIVHVPYKGSGPALADAVGGQVEILFDNLPSSMPMIQAGKLRALAIAWPKRIDSMKDVPTLEQAGYPQLNQPVWYGLLAPAGTPSAIVNKLRDAAVVALKDPNVVRVLEEQGSTPSGNTPAEFAAEIKAQFDWARDVVTKQKIEMK